MLDALVARGGTSSVYRATDLETGRKVAVKILAPTIAAIPGFRARVLREATVLRNLTSEHSVRVHAASTEASATYLVLELLDGADLRKVLETEATFDVTRAVDVVLETCDAVAEAHQLGVVHRDLKPENILLVRDANGEETVRVIDFGIAKLVGVDGRGRLAGGRLAAALHGAGADRGRRGRRRPHGRVRARRVLYELLVGTTPFGGASLSELYGSISPARWRSSRPTPAKLAAVIRSALDPRRDRPATVAAFARRSSPASARARAARHRGARRRAVVAPHRRRRRRGDPGVVVLEVAAPARRSARCRWLRGCHDGRRRRRRGRARHDVRVLARPGRRLPCPPRPRRRCGGSSRRRRAHASAILPPPQGPVPRPRP